MTKTSGDDEDLRRVLLFMDLPTEILMHILSYLDLSSLYIISGLNNEMHRLTLSKRWREIEGRRRTPLNRSRKFATFCLKKVHNGTRTLLLTARSRFKRLFPGNILFSQPSYNMLTVLALENQRFPKYVALKAFPTGLQELSLRNSYTDTDETFFKYSDSAMSDLRVLILDGCRWVRTWILVSVSKYPKLQILSMVRCTKALDDDVYVSMAAVYGFNSLRVCDVRHTKLADSLVSSMVLYKPQLQSLYFSSYSAAFYPDIIAQMRRQMQQPNWHGQGRLECVGEEMDFDERKVSACKKVLGTMDAGFRFKANTYQNISDVAGFYFKRLRDAVDDADFAEMLLDKVAGDMPVDHCSMLYTDPYSEPCICKGRVEPPLSEEDPLPNWPVCSFAPIQSELQQTESSRDDQGRATEPAVLVDRTKNMKHRRRRRMFEIAFVPYGYNYTEDAREVAINETWDEISGDEYESCCREYNLVTTQTYSCTTTPVTAAAATDTRKRKRPRADSSSSSDNSDSYSTCDSSSSDSESDHDNKQRRRKRRTAKKPRAHRACSPKSITITIPPSENDYPDVDDDYDDNGDPLVLQGAPIEDLPPIRDGAVYVVPVQQLHRSVPSKLTQLSLRGYKKITNTMLDSLDHLHNMRVLDVTGTLVTAEGVYNYMSTHPQCRVIHETTCRCVPIIRL